MEFVPIDVSQTTGPDWLRLPADVRGNWLALMSLCAQRENGGVIVGAAEWSSRDWDRAAGMTKRALDSVVSAGLARWTETGGLVVVGYDVEREESARNGRIQRSNAAKAKHAKAAARTAAALPAASAVAAAVSPSPLSEPQCRSDQIRTEQIREEIPPTPQGGSVRSIQKTRDARAVLLHVLGYLNRLTGRHLEPTDDRMKAVKRILGQGKRLEDIKVVVWSKCCGPKKWLGDEEREQYLTPETLLAKKHFQKYWEQGRDEYIEHSPERAAELGFTKPEPEGEIHAA